jgi:hypothetical protein
MANTNFVIQNGVTVGALSIWAANGDVTSSGNITTLGAVQITGYHTGAVGANTPNTGAFTTLTATNTANFQGTITAATVNATTIGNSATALSGTSLAVAGTITAATMYATTMGNSATALSGTSLAVAGTITAATVNATTIGNSATALSGTSLAVAGTITAATVNATTIGNSATVFTASSSTLTNSISVNSANGVTAIVNGGTSGTGNIGASGATFNTVFAKATTAQYADLAECYAGDADYEPGTVLEFGGNDEVTIASDGSASVAGVVSTNPAHLMNSAIDANYPVAVALTGRVPTKVIGTVRKGQMMISAGNGFAKAESSPSVGTVIGKSLENFDGETGIIEVVVGKI